MGDVLRAKYPLAVLAKALAVLPPSSASGMDVNCAFKVTAGRSCLAPEIKSKHHAFIVNAFHGYSHNYLCQQENHPTVVPGAGIEDFETMERIFSSSNAVAGVTRHASPYRRRLFIDAYFRQWDQDKYENLGNFILNNYNQALASLAVDVPALEEAMRKFNLTDVDLDRIEKEETEFFSQLGKEDPHNTLRVEYVELLQSLRDTLARKNGADSSYYNHIGNNFIAETPQGSQPGYSKAVSATNRLESERRKARDRLEVVQNDVIAMEMRLGISRRWEPSDPEYREALKYMQDRKYHKALDTIHQLVVQRLFELHRMNLSGTGNVF